jgi:hypothetical protein
MTAPILAQTEIKTLVDYNPETGFFSKNGWAVGAYREGYLKLYLRKTTYQAHRIAWTYVHGEWPSDDVIVDHKNCIRHDNRITNLRLVTHAENMQNKVKPQGNNPFLGVTYNRFSKKWNATITANGKRIGLGSAFATPEEASEAYLAAKRKLHLGFIG